LSISCPEEVHFLARETLFEIPLLGPLIRCLNSHPVARDASDLQTFKDMLKLLEEGKKLILFPEGQRSFDGELLPFERGLAFLANKAECRIIPAYIEGGVAAWPRAKKFPHLFGKMRIAFGSPIEWHSGDKRAVEKRLTEETERAIRALKRWLESGAEGSPP
jgi:1-acyl-sn-glycerol-3-phosphate acyltransferase